ncbi:MAG: molybdopterin cofactor-binding domain-containing protein [Woeseiaceae bacterium]
MNPVKQLSRRDFVKTGGLFVLGVSMAGCGRQDKPAITASRPADGPWSPDVFVSFDADGTVHIISHRSEMGQGTRTGLAAIVADELEADWGRVIVEQAMADAVYGDQNTDGSWSVRGFMQRMREAGASARQMLEQAAADEWQVDVSECRAENHRILHDASARSLDYKDLVAAAAALPVPAPDTLSFKPPEKFRYIGKDMPIVDLDDMIHGRAGYGIDASVAGMKYAVIARCPVTFGRVKSFDAEAALALDGVRQVIELPAATPPALFQALGGIAVIADNTWAAMEGRKRLKIEWDEGDNTSYNSDDYKAQLQAATRRDGQVVREEGDVTEAFANAEVTLDAEFYTPHLAHAPMEPPVALASVTADSCEVWAPTQNPQSIIKEGAAITGLAPEQIKVHVTLLGGGFGRKSKCDFVNEAIILSKSIGAPVKVVWSREDDIRHDYFHAPSAQYLKASINSENAVSGWLHRVAYPTIMSTFEAGAKHPAGWEIGMGAINMPYDIANVNIASAETEAKIRIGWLRSVCNIFQAFAVCSFTDEIAYARNKDPLENFLDMLGTDRHLDFSSFGQKGVDNYPFDTARLRHVAELAAGKAGWGRVLPGGHGLGIAVHRSFLSYVAAVVEVAVDSDGRWSVPRVDIAFDCGLAVNPDRVRAQLEGSVIFGLSLAREGKITATNGRVDQGNFDDYPVLRMDMTPETSVHIVHNDAPPAGVGEPGVPPIAPALANAIFAATGTRLREMPFGPQIAV